MLELEPANRPEPDSVEKSPSHQQSQKGHCRLNPFLPLPPDTPNPRLAYDFGLYFLMTND